MNIEDLNVRIFADGADLNQIKKLAENPYVKGFTTNPTLMRKSGVDDYQVFASTLLEIVEDRPVSFEVFADDVEEMGKQARVISTWGQNVNIKIPIVNTLGESTIPLIRDLSAEGIVVNVTAIFTLEQAEAVVEALCPESPAMISIFAGRIADTGLDPVPIMKAAVEVATRRPKLEVLWASPREILNLLQADQSGCHIITIPVELMEKLPLIGKDLNVFSLETVKLFHNDAKVAGYYIETECQPVSIYK